MAEISEGRWTAKLDGDFVVFIIGAKVRTRFEGGVRCRYSDRCGACWLTSRGIGWPGSTEVSSATRATASGRSG